MWYSHNFTIPRERSRLKKLWEETLELTKIGDMILGDHLWYIYGLERNLRIGYEDTKDSNGDTGMGRIGSSMGPKRGSPTPTRPTLLSSWPRRISR